MILKWGGALTPLGEAQAQWLGESLRKTLYPDPSGGGVLRLHATRQRVVQVPAGPVSQLLARLPTSVPLEYVNTNIEGYDYTAFEQIVALNRRSGGGS